MKKEDIVICDGRKAAKISMWQWHGRAEHIAWEKFHCDFLPYDEENDVFYVDDVDYCIDIVRARETDPDVYFFEKRVAIPRYSNVDINILSAFGWPTNPQYGQGNANDGGCYWQYAGGIVAEVSGHTVAVEIIDDSCGEFGSRYCVTVSTEDYEWIYCDGGMDDSSLDDEAFIIAVKDSISAILRVNAEDLICLARHAANLCARQRQREKDMVAAEAY